MIKWLKKVLGLEQEKSEKGGVPVDDSLAELAEQIMNEDFDAVCQTGNLVEVKRMIASLSDIKGLVCKELARATRSGDRGGIDSMMTLRNRLDKWALDTLGSDAVLDRVGIEPGWEAVADQLMELEEKSDLGDLLVDVIASTQRDQTVSFLKNIAKAGHSRDDSTERNSDTIDSAERLEQACRAGDIDGVERLLVEGVSAAGRGGDTFPLKIAASQGHRDVVARLLAHGADPNATGIYNSTAIFAAAVEGHDDIVSLLLDAGAKADALDYAEAGVLNYVAGGSPQLVKRLLDLGAEVNRVSQRGSSPLCVACHGGKVENVKILLDAGADPELRGVLKTPLEIAECGGHSEIVEILQKRLVQQDQPPKANVVVITPTEEDRMLLMLSGDREFMCLVPEEGESPRTARECYDQCVLWFSEKRGKATGELFIELAVLDDGREVLAIAGFWLRHVGIGLPDEVIRRCNIFLGEDQWYLDRRVSKSLAAVRIV